MSLAVKLERLKKAIASTGGSWLLDLWDPDPQAELKFLETGLEEFVREYQQRFGDRPDPFALLESNPTKATAFFHMDTLMLSTEMKIMVWRILLGCEIIQVDLQYRADLEPSLLVVLRPPYGKTEERYRSNRGLDYQVFRHFGMAGIFSKFILQGYYAGTRGNA
jgi:hypothetical protein